MKGFRNPGKATFILLSILLLALGGCGGGTDTPLTGSVNPSTEIEGVSSGAITTAGEVQSGTVRLNGMDFQTSGIKVMRKGVEVPPSQLKAGMVVKLRGHFREDGRRGEGREIEIDEILEGPVAAIDSTNMKLTILGQEVRVSSTTVFDGVSGFTGLTVGTMVEVSGMRDADGNILATRIEKESDSFVPNRTEVELEGIVGTINGQSFTIGDLTVQSNTPLPAALMVGKLVEVEGTMPALSGPLNAREIEVKQGGVGAGDGQIVHLSGLITSYVSNANFTVDGTQVNAQGVTITGLGLNVMVQVDGKMAGAILMATSVTILSTPVPPPPPPPPVLSALTINPASVQGGTNSQGTVTLDKAAPSGGTIVGLSDNSASAAVPATVTVPAGAASANFTITTSAVSSNTTATITASYGGVNKTADLAITPAPPPPPSPPVLSSLTVNPASVQGGINSQGTVTLDKAAPSGGITVNLSDNLAAAAVPATVTVAAGAVSANFTITTSAVSSNTTATITASYGGVSKIAYLAITTAPPVLSALTVNPTSVQGGTSSQGTVTLDKAAPSGGITVNLSDNSAAAAVPATVTVAAGAMSANFTITTSAVSSNTVATITASYGGVSKNAGLTITAPAIDGAALYSTYCSGCHGPLASSNKRGASATSIQGAIDSNKGGMGAFSFLTPAEVAAIAAALNF